MKINNNCARKVLIELEKIPFEETLTVAQLQEKISEFSLEEVLNIVTLFHKGNYLSIIGKFSYDDNDVLRDNKIKGLTEKGYRNLDLIRDKKLWNLMKEKLTNFDDLSIYTILDLANKIKNVEENKLFDLPLDLLSKNDRW